MGQQTYCGGALQLYDGAIARLEINRASACNAVKADMWQAIEQVAKVIAESSASKVLIISGLGRHFSAGADMVEF